MAVKNGTSTSPRASQEAAKQRPAHEVRLGRMRAAIWANQNDNGTWYSVTLSRSYKDGDEWKSSTSFGRDDLLTLAKVADLANSWIHHEQSQSNNSNSGGDGGDNEIPE